MNGGRIPGVLVDLNCERRAHPWRAGGLPRVERPKTEPHSESEPPAGRPSEVALVLHVANGANAEFFLKINFAARVSSEEGDVPDSAPSMGEVYFFQNKVQENQKKTSHRFCRILLICKYSIY